MIELNSLPLINKRLTQSYLFVCYCYKASLSEAKTSSKDKQSFTYFSSLFHEHSVYYMPWKLSNTTWLSSRSKCFNCFDTFQDLQKQTDHSEDKEYYERQLEMFFSEEMLADRYSKPVRLIYFWSGFITVKFLGIK